MKLVNVENRTAGYSLRVLEWFCGNYCKKYVVIYKVNGKDFNVYISYKAQLDSYSKKQFDPFKRDHKGYGKFWLKYNGNSKIETAICQLNFFRWCIENGILDYVKKHITAIKNDMNNSMSDKSEDTDRKKRQPLSQAVTRTCVKRYTKVLIKFK